eukprot:m.1322135 g.1322135  ORF g.1322135 m.1322135 type:complete len:175 (+) comp24848_c1_seq19:273-797(+)
MCFEEDRRSRRDAKHASSDAKSQVVVTKPSMTVVSGDSRTTLPSLKAIGPTASLAGRRRRQLLSMGCGDVRRVFVAAGSVSNMSFFTPTTLGVVHLDTCMTRADTVLHVYGIAYDANEHCGSDELERILRKCQVLSTHELDSSAVYSYSFYVCIQVYWCIHSSFQTCIHTITGT